MATRGQCGAQRHGLAALIALMLIADPDGARESAAAVRVCGNVVVGDVAFDPDERKARRHALRNWKAKVASYGASFQAWRLAGDRSLGCAASGGGFHCVARGRPCRIRQKPPLRREPPGPEGVEKAV